MTDIQAIASQFEGKTLPKEQWTHHAHIAVAFVELYASKNFDKALERVRANIKAYNQSVGTENTDTSGYHETLTVFWLTVVREYLLSKPHENMNVAYEGFLKTMLASSKSPTFFYTRELLFSKEARHNWVLPNLLPMAKIQELLHTEQHFIFSDQEFEEQFANATFDPALFTHEAHIRLAWVHVLKYGEAKAIEHITRQLYNYVSKLGATDKYNETLTVAAIKAVKHFMGKNETDTFQEFIAIHSRLKYQFKELIAKHYQFDIFKSEEAKRQYIAPDLLAFT